MPEKSIRHERWRPLIEATRNEGALIAVMREYCGTLLPADIAKLPVACPECAVRSATDIGELAVDYTSIELKYDREDDARAILHDLALTFCAAAEQLKRLRHPLLRGTDA